MQLIDCCRKKGDERKDTSSSAFTYIFLLITMNWKQKTNPWVENEIKNCYKCSRNENCASNRFLIFFSIPTRRFGRCIAASPLQSCDASITWTVPLFHGWAGLMSRHLRCCSREFLKNLHRQLSSVKFLCGNIYFCFYELRNEIANKQRCIICNMVFMERKKNKYFTTFLDGALKALSTSFGPGHLSWMI